MEIFRAIDGALYPRVKPITSASCRLPTLSFGWKAVCGSNWIPMVLGVPDRVRAAAEAVLHRGLDRFLCSKVVLVRKIAWSLRGRCSLLSTNASRHSLSVGAHDGFWRESPLASVLGSCRVRLSHDCIGGWIYRRRAHHDCRLCSIVLPRSMRSDLRTQLKSTGLFTLRDEALSELLW